MDALPRRYMSRCRPYVALLWMGLSIWGWMRSARWSRELADLVVLSETRLMISRNSEKIKYVMVNGRLPITDSMNEAGTVKNPRLRFGGSKFTWQAWLVYLAAIPKPICLTLTRRRLINFGLRFRLSWFFLRYTSWLGRFRGLDHLCSVPIFEERTTWTLEHERGISASSFAYRNNFEHLL